VLGRAAPRSPAQHPVRVRLGPIGHGPVLRA
jgi:hypothetical protein